MSVRGVPRPAGHGKRMDPSVRLAEKETPISPTDMPRPEDHAHRSIASDAAGSLWVTWSRDTSFKAESQAFAPTFGPAALAAGDGGREPDANHAERNSDKSTTST